MSNFEKAMKTVMEQSVLKMIKSGDMLNIPYGSKVNVPESFMSEIWGMVDHEKIKKNLARNIEEIIADKICNNIAAEISTDLKQLLSVKERREALRAVARENIDRICKA